jgi:mRNA interferase MazF
MIQRGEIYFVDLDPTRGREQSGRRPVLVLSSDKINKLPLVVTVIVGTKGDTVSRDFKTNVRVAASESGLPIETVFLGFQVRSIDQKRFPSVPAGKVSDQIMQRIEASVRYCLEL